MNKLKQQYQLWIIALGFFTRIPVRFPAELDDGKFHQASRYFALVGCFVGVFLAICYYLLQLLLPNEIAIILLLGIDLLLTGAFHEDGWADVWDGFGGGWQKSDKLNIMKDSRLGTYGASALFIALALKYQSLVFLSSELFLICFSLVLANTLSRSLAASLIFSMAYVREDESSKVKPVTKTMPVINLLVLIAAALLVLACGLVFDIYQLDFVFYSVGILMLTRYLLKVWFNQQLGGYTGDCLGAAQVASELIVYLLVIVFVINEVGVLNA